MTRLSADRIDGMQYREGMKSVSTQLGSTQPSVQTCADGWAQGTDWKTDRRCEIMEGTKCGSCGDYTSEEDMRFDPMVEVTSKWGTYWVHVDDCLDPQTETIITDPREVE